MNLFQPSSRILEAICMDEKSYSQHVVFPGSTTQPGLAKYFSGLVTQIKGFYWSSYNQEFSVERGDFRKVRDIAWEALENARVHGVKKDGWFAFGLFIGRKGICYGFQDSGGFFKRQEIKKNFEKKIPITEFDERNNSRRIGVNQHIFEYSDLIEVDSEEGVLYCVQYI